MDEDVSLSLVVYEGHGLNPENGWNVMVVGRLEEKELFTSPVPLTSQPKFEVEMSWNISVETLCLLRKSGVSVQVECLTQQQHGGEHRSLGYALLPLPLPNADLKMEAKWYSLVNGSHNRCRIVPSLLLGLSLKRGGVEVVEDLTIQKPKQKNALNAHLHTVSSKKIKSYFTINATVDQEGDMLSKLSSGEEGSGKGSSKRLPVRSKETDEIKFVGHSNHDRHGLVTIEDTQENSEKSYKHTLQSKCTQYIPKSLKSVQGFHEPSNSVHGNSTSATSLIKNADSPIQKSHSSPSKSLVKENGYVAEPQPSSSLSNDVVAVPSTSGTALGRGDKLRAIPLLNAQGSYFQIGPADEQGEQMFEYSVTVIYAKYLDQLVPPDMEINEANHPLFCYSLLSHFVYGEPIQDLANPDFQAENAMGRICSTVHNLSEYFLQHPNLPINLTAGDVCLATATVRLAPFASSILTGGLPVQVEAGYPLVPNLFSPLGWKPSGEPVVGVMVTLSTSGSERPPLPFSAGVRDVMDSDRGFHPLLDYSTESSAQLLSDSQEDSVIDLDDHRDGRSHPRNHGTVARFNSKYKSRLKPWIKKERQLQVAALEVEKWKENEQESFWKRWNAREAELQQHLAQEWELHMSNRENQLQQSLEQCRTLHVRLTEGLYSLGTRERSVTLKEENIKTQKEELKFRKAELKQLLKEVDNLSKKERKKAEKGEVINLQQQLLHEKRQRRLLQRQVKELEAAKETCESTVDALRLGSRIKDEDINLLKREKNRLQEELLDCSQKMEYYKMQWAKTMEQVHKINTDMNTYRVDIEKPSPELYQTKKSIQYKDDRQKNRRPLKSLADHKLLQDEGWKGRVTEKITESKKFVTGFVDAREELNMVTKRKRMEENESNKDDIKVLSSSDVRSMMHSLANR